MVTQDRKEDPMPSASSLGKSMGRSNGSLCTNTTFFPTTYRPTCPHLILIKVRKWPCPIMGEGRRLSHLSEKSQASSEDVSSTPSGEVRSAHLMHEASLVFKGNKEDLEQLMDEQLKTVKDSLCERLPDALSRPLWV